MIHTNECQTCGKAWPCTRVLTMCLSCTEKAQMLDQSVPDFGYFECSHGHAYCGRH